MGGEEKLALYMEPLPGPQLVTCVLKLLGTAADLLALTPREALQLFAWTVLMLHAYNNASQSLFTPSLHLNASSEETFSRIDLPLLQPAGSSASAAWPVYPHHCYVDHPNVRDIPFLINFNTFPKQILGSNATAVSDWGRSNLAILRQAYSSYTPLIVASTDYSSLGLQPELLDISMFGCNANYMTDRGWGGGTLGEECAGRLVNRFPGHLGYVIIQVKCLAHLRTS
jgi:hypothetical protein